MFSLLYGESLVRKIRPSMEICDKVMTAVIALWGCAIEPRLSNHPVSYNVCPKTRVDSKRYIFWGAPPPPKTPPSTTLQRLRPSWVEDERRRSWHERRTRVRAIVIYNLPTYLPTHMYSNRYMHAHAAAVARYENYRANDLSIGH